MNEGAILRFKDVGTQNGAIYIAWSDGDLKWEEERLWSVSQTSAMATAD